MKLSFNTFTYSCLLSFASEAGLKECRNTRKGGIGEEGEERREYAGIGRHRGGNLCTLLAIKYTS